MSSTSPMFSTESEPVPENILTKHNPNRFSLLPIHYPELHKLYEEQKRSYWWSHEVVFVDKDRTDWKGLNDNERHFIQNILAFFATSDGIVMENIVQQFMSEIQIPEARSFFTIQLNIELVHSEVYANLLDYYIADEKLKLKLLRANSEISSVKAKADWAMKWITHTRPLSERLVAFCAVEGIFFSGAFCCIYWLAEKGVLPALTFSNELIRRDEGLHVNNGIVLYRMGPKLSDDKVHEILLGALDAESIFITDTLSCDLLGMNKNLMKKYLEHVANDICIRLGHSPLFQKTVQPFPFMDKIFLYTKENFFETRVTNYKQLTYGDEGDSFNFNAEV